jgi:hypothetical protein
MHELKGWADALGSLWDKKARARFIHLAVETKFNMQGRKVHFYFWRA